MAAEAAARGEGHDDGYFPILEVRILDEAWLRGGLWWRRGIRGEQGLAMAMAQQPGNVNVAGFLQASRRLRNRVIMMLWMRMLLRQLVVRWWLRVHFRRFMWVWHLRVLRARVRLFLWRIRHDHLVYILDTIMVLAYVVFKINASFIGYIEFVKLNCSSASLVGDE
ncbi:hypothetical protein OsJ_32276 [Oryza sativa Japonica Group]|uniref:Uncharacterized protein n=3 Tax=Oryza TaxID=4527 RepID=A3C6T9_ORYSJ|nr:hypothetical protein [Oryza sativa Japonica Group]AAM88636.1 hypothetical protein [Oryza sativa Japonica Group]AAP54802.1 hypothetical protein LOC_Os10g39060 [Oryza sativa Japonica Group]EAZ16802.1 hypothetical protein OsJ_32276 [Oryza sativa Japonica Group]